jgi:signal transduction histidine kinase
MRSGTPVVIEQASLDPRYSQRHTPKHYDIESYVSVPIVMASGRYFGNLCAMDPAPTTLSAPILNTFTHFAALIAMQLDSEIVRENAEVSLRDERASSELREQFIAVLGHDLRNPLQAIYATSDLMVRRVNDPAIAGMAARIKANSRRMSSLIDDVLDFARGRLGGGIGLHLGEVENLNEGLTSVVNELQDGQPSRRIDFEFNVARTVVCDVSRVQQVASNLIGNALKHGAPDSAIKVTAIADDHDFVFEVWNEGEPIPPDSLAKVFEPFWRRETSANRDGLGLGLHICSQILRAHGGRLSVTSSSTAGTTLLDVEPEVHDIALADDVFLALEAQFPGLLRPRLALVGDEIVVGDDFGANESMLEVRVNDARRLRRRRPRMHRPGPHFLRPAVK